MIKSKIFFLSILTLILLSPFVYSLEFTINNAETLKNALYETDYATFRSSITYAGQSCTTTCQWKIGTSSSSFTCLAATCPFEFNINAKSGQGSVSDTLTVTCENLAWQCRLPGMTPGPTTMEKTIPFSYPYKGDGVCTISSGYEDCTTAKLDCPCSAGTACIDAIDSAKWNGRTSDDKKCVNYCGNGIKESSFESCSTCPGDVGKCDGVPCSSGSECEGKYCVHGLCANSPFKSGDGVCDNNLGENCKNSVNDCACLNNQRCGASGVCETFCGNNICEESEKGICKADCKWCGDGECNGVDNCKNCPEDCGKCKEDSPKTTTTSVSQTKNLESNNEVQKESSNSITGEAVVGQQSSNDKTKLLTIIGLSVLALLILIWGIYFIKQVKAKVAKKDGKD